MRMAVVLGVLALLDVMPRCGERKLIHEPLGAQCGGPMVCDDSQCEPVDQLDGGFTRLCTRPCTADADCASMGDFACLSSAEGTHQHFCGPR